MSTEIYLFAKKALSHVKTNFTRRIIMSWRLKSLIQNVLSVTPFGGRINYLLQRYVTKAYSESSIFRSYSVQVEHIASVNERRPLCDSTILEIGPGCFSISGLIFYLLGVKKIILVDVSRNLKHDLVLRYSKVILKNIAKVSGDLRIPRNTIIEKLAKVVSTKNLEQYLENINCRYYAPLDIRSLVLPRQSVDLVYSYGVLEHIPKPIIVQIFSDSLKYLKSNGRHYHNIGLHDHFNSAGLGNGVNFLKYSPLQWKIIAGNRFAYHNRLRKSDCIKIITELGYRVTYQADELLDLNIKALEKIKVHSYFSSYDRTDLAYSALYVECEKLI
jgi:phage gp36-like protein